MHLYDHVALARVRVRCLFHHQAVDGGITVVGSHGLHRGSFRQRGDFPTVPG
ncbi:hypothetical protein [Streptomyces sp. F001]|uniref:hypothetical protein n=1 Tax=Streptomyces sp. F001 TaxID=1510026 RepID=UPI001F106E71|nr:hypothetical protein [Streptomyces sp. F001]